MAMPFIKGIGPLELVIILVIVMIIFGVGRLTEIGGALGKSIREFRRASTDDVSDDSSESKDKPKQETT
jgi:sec-independent protein translocase protein TatA